MIVAAMLMLAEAPVDTKAPYRIAAENIPLSISSTDAVACAARAMSRQWRVTPYPMPDGAGLDFALDQPLKLYSGAPSMVGYQFRNAGDKSTLTVVYRHPFSTATAIMVVRDTAKICFAADWNAWAVANDRKPVKARGK